MRNFITVLTVSQNDLASQKSFQNGSTPYGEFILAVEQHELTDALNMTHLSCFSREMGLSLTAIAQGREPQNYVAGEVA